VLVPASEAQLHSDTDYLIVVRTLEAQIGAWQRNWWEEKGLGKGDAFRLSLPPFFRFRLTCALMAGAEHSSYIQSMGSFYLHYLLLVVNSFGLQNALERAPENRGYFFARCHSAATKCATLITQELGPLGYLRYSPDSHFVQCSYAVLSLLKVCAKLFIRGVRLC
jgi:hypothetical protein